MVLVIDTSGSMAGNLNAMAKAAAKLVVDTLTSADYVTIVKYSSRAYSYTSTLVKATDATKTELKAWIDTNIDASGTTNFRAAFEKAWEVVDATTTSSGCNRIMLFLSDGVPNAWDANDYAAVARKSASYSPPMHLLTYGLGKDADPTVLKGIACGSSGIYYSVTESTISDTMASYFQVLAPMLSPCKLRWTLYNDYYTGQQLLGACLASFELESANSATSCNGGLSGLGENGDSRVPKLIGVGCVDMNLVVDLGPELGQPGYPEAGTLRAHPEWDTFWAKVESDMAVCPRIELTKGQMETLRGEAGGASAMCGAEEAKEATKEVVLTLTASGSVSDYSDTSSLQQKIATAAGVDKSFVTISVAAASVIITATITVPASMTAAAVQTSLSSTLGTADKASAALGITVESDSTIKTVTVTDPPIKTVPEGDSDSSSMGAIIGGVGEQRPCYPAPARTPPVLPQAYHPADLAPRVACPTHSWRRACALLLLHRHRRRRLLLHEAEEATRLRKHLCGDGTCYGAAANRGDRVSAGSTGQAGRSAAKLGCAPCGVRSRAPRTGVRRRRIHARAPDQRSATGPRSCQARPP